MSSLAADTTSARFNAADADVTFRSSDRVLFRVHRNNLAVCAEGFPPPEFPTGEEIADLTETSETLDLLFQFVYPQRHPNLESESTPFATLASLAEAAEKYQVFGAMGICYMYMKARVDENPTAVAVYAEKHGYQSLVSLAAPLMLGLSLPDVIEALPPHLVVPWVKYLNEWSRVLKTAMIAPSNTLVYHYGADGNTSCSLGEGPWSQVVAACVQQLGEGVHRLRTLDIIFAPVTFLPPRELAYCCKVDLTLWRQRIENAVAAIPEFSTFL
ncbi:hypothetical protein C8J57DRAFT_1491589 [Mycena rebaudengoi]|nr:hypothetical protein C8J57DRAFT_1491589 [Mycena rebaudengoi]